MDLFVKESGNFGGPVICFLHGGGVSGWMWDKQVSSFWDYHVLIPDLPSHGKSNDTHFISIRNTAEEIIKVIERKADGKKICIIGFSLGAQIVVELLSIRPQMFERAVICSALVRPIHFGKNLIISAVKMSSGLLSNRVFQKVQSKVQYISEEYFERYYNETKQTTVKDLVTYLNANMQYALPDSFKHHNVKTLVLVGKKEKGIMLKSSMDIMNSNSNCEVYVIPHIGHGLPLANPDLFNTIIRAWLNNEKLPREFNQLLGRH